MNKILNILIITLLVFVSCKKDKDFSGVNVVLKNVSVSTGVADMTYYAEYSYPANLKAVTMLLSENSAMSNARTVKCDVGYLTIKATVTDLKENATYYYRLKYDTGFGVLGSEVNNFVMGDAGDGKPVVLTVSVTDVTQTSAVCSGRVPSDGGYYVTTRGVCWSTSQNPTLSDAHNSNYYGTGDYVVNMPCLSPNTLYYVRTYAVNEKGTSYGNEVSFKTNGIVGNHEYVDLGLPSGVLWATCNIGADSPEDYGNYYAWGETVTKGNYSWETYQWCNGSYSTLTKYNTNSGYGIVDNKTVLEIEDDAAHVNWGGSWRMPTEDEIIELKTNCTYKWTNQNGVYGQKITGPNGSSIFMPAAGRHESVTLNHAGSQGYYLSTMLFTGNSLSAWGLNIWSMGWGDSVYGRSYGHPVRPVSSPKKIRRVR